VFAVAMVDDFKAVACGVGNEDASAPCIERAVIEGAARSIRYGNDSDCLQRHDGLAVPSVEQKPIGEQEK
jgi:hypothetical protein